MAIKDIKTMLQQQLVLNASIATDTTTNGESVDTADFELGLMWNILAPNYTDGSYAVSFEESDTGAFAGEETVVPTEKIIGTLADMTVAAATAVPGVTETIGIFSNLRYVRPVITSTGTTSGAVLAMICTQKAETMPVV